MVSLKRQNPWVIAFSGAILLIGIYTALFAPPSNFPTKSTITISKGSAAPSVARQLVDARVIARPSLFLFLLRMTGTSSFIQAGPYRFESPENLFVVMYRIVVGDYGLPSVRITFPEGTTVRDAASLIDGNLPEVSDADFLKLAKPYEGYLFPDTYVFPPSSDASSIVALMRINFNTKIAPLSAEITSSGRSLSDVITLASLIEREARSSESKRMVAGILENRLKLGMPLQVDAVFGYIFDRDTYSPSLKDLTVDSPYNTYTHTGLPPGPICNPGLDSIEAVLNPTKTDNLYYLTGRDGLMHYATTYAGHQANRRKYLR